MVIWATINTEFSLAFGFFVPWKNTPIKFLCVHVCINICICIFGLLDMLPNSFPPAQV